MSIRIVSRRGASTDARSWDQLLLRAKNRDVAAFEELVTLASPYLLYLCGAIVRNSDLALDALQIGILKVWRSLPNYEDRGRAKAWICQIVLRAALALRRREAHHAAVIARIAPEYAIRQHSRSVSPEAEAMRREVSACLGKAVAALPEGQRVVVTLRLAGCTFAESVKSLAPLRQGTVASRLHNGLEKVGEALGPELAEQYAECW